MHPGSKGGSINPSVWPFPVEFMGMDTHSWIVSLCLYTPTLIYSVFFASFFSKSIFVSPTQGKLNDVPKTEDEIKVISLSSEIFTLLRIENPKPVSGSLKKKKKVIFANIQWILKSH